MIQPLDTTPDENTPEVYAECANALIRLKRINPARTADLIKTVDPIERSKLILSLIEGLTPAQRLEFRIQQMEAELRLFHHRVARGAGRTTARNLLEDLEARLRGDIGSIVQ